MSTNKQQFTAKHASRALRIVSPTYVATAFLLVFLVIALVVGSFVVRVPLLVEGQGMLMADNEVVNYAIQPESEGRLEEFFVKVGSRVSKGAMIARVSIPRLESEIETADSGLRSLRQKERLLEAYQKESLEAGQVTLRQQRAEARNREQVLRERLTRLERAIEGDADLIRKGFLSARGGDNAMTEKGQVEDQMFTSKRQLLEAEASFAELVQRLRREKLELTLQLTNQERQLQALVERRKVEGAIPSPFDGVVSELLVDLHQPVNRERRVATILPSASVAESSSNLVTTAVVFVPAAQGKKLQAGMVAQLRPLIYEEQEFGRIEGVVAQVSSVASDEDVLLRVFKNQKLVRKLFESEAPYRVLVNVKADPGTRSGMAWTSSRGPSRLLEPGTIVSGWVVYDDRRLLYLLLPAVRRLSENAWVNLSELWGSPADGAGQVSR
jgi:HlyD family secretion protein